MLRNYSLFPIEYISKVYFIITPFTNSPTISFLKLTKHISFYNGGEPSKTDHLSRPPSWRIFDDFFFPLYPWPGEKKVIDQKECDSCSRHNSSIPPRRWRKNRRKYIVSIERHSCVSLSTRMSRMSRIFTRVEKGEFINCLSHIKRFIFHSRSWFFAGKKRNVSIETGSAKIYAYLD